MARSTNQKLKLLILKDFLERNTDEDHPAATAQLIQELERHEISAERKSVYDDMAALQQYGLDVQSRKGRAAGWFIGERAFQLPELKLLVDAVQSSRFITRRKSDALIRKLEGLASVHQARQLQRQVFVDRRVKTMNESIYYSVDKLHAALSAGKQVSFRYFDYNVRKERVFRHDGQRYTVSPRGLVWDNENYYLVAYDPRHGETRHYRVDKMAELAVTCLPRDREGAEPFDMAAYAQRHFGMFTGREATVRLRCENRLAQVILDRFGMEVILVPDGADHFIVALELAVSPQFFGWLFGLGDGVELLSPDWAVAGFRAHLQRVAARSGGHDAPAEGIG